MSEHKTFLLNAIGRPFFIIKDYQRLAVDMKSAWSGPTSQPPLEILKITLFFLFLVKKKNRVWAGWTHDVHIPVAVSAQVNTQLGVPR